MIEYEELRAEIDRYPTEQFKYRKSLIYLEMELSSPSRATIK